MTRFSTGFLIAFGLVISSASSNAQIALGFDIEVTDPSRLLAAMDKYTESETSSSIPATAILSQYVANGNSSADTQPSSFLSVS